MAQKGEFFAENRPQEASFAPKSDLPAKTRLERQALTPPGMVPSVFGDGPTNPTVKAQSKERVIDIVADTSPVMGHVEIKDATSAILNADMDNRGELDNKTQPHDRDGALAEQKSPEQKSNPSSKAAKIAYAGEQLENSGNMTKGRSGREYLTFLGGLSGTLNYVRQSSSHLVLDIGAGTTRGISEIAKSDDGQGLDYRATVMQEDENITNYLGNERTLLTSVEELEGVEDNSVGLAIGINSIAYSTDPKTAIASIDRVLVPGGVLKATFQDPEKQHIFVPMNDADAFVAALRDKEYDVEVVKNTDEDTDVIVVLALKPGATVTAKDLLEADLQSLPTETEDEKGLKESINRGYGIGLDLLGHLQSPSAEDIRGATEQLRNEFGYDETSSERIQQKLLERYLSSAPASSAEQSSDEH